MEKIGKYIKNPFRRLFILLASKGFFTSMNDQTYLKLMYKAKTGKPLDLENPKTFNEKLQWLKLHDRNPRYTQMVDKYEAKRYVAERIGGQYIIPTFGVWETFEDISFDQLPEQFVLKCTHDSGGLVICKDKSRLDIEKAKEKIEHSLKKNYYIWGREWPYKEVKPRILAEKYIKDATDAHGLTDYKFYCFNGIPRYLYVSQGSCYHGAARRGFLTMEWELAPFGRKDYVPLEELPPKPEQFEHMKKIAEILSSGHRFLRVDLYEVNHAVFFSELTFYPCGGFRTFEPEEWDDRLGKMLVLEDHADMSCKMDQGIA